MIRKKELRSKFLPTKPLLAVFLTIFFISVFTLSGFFIIIKKTQAQVTITVTFSNINITSLRVNWNDVSGESTYKISRSTNGTSFTEIATKSANVTYHDDSGLTANTHYWYKVEAWSGPSLLGSGTANTWTNCGDNSSCNESDYSSTNCSQCGGAWGLTSDDAGGSCWNSPNAKCCGDDSQEFPNSCFSIPLSGNSGASCGSSGTSACCDTFADCVYNGGCYRAGNMGGGDIIDTADSSSDSELCDTNGGYDIKAGWVDQDYKSAFCTNQSHIWFSSASSCGSGVGPGGVCDDADGGAFCCGDDSNEMVEYFREYPGTSIAWSGSALCCPSIGTYPYYCPANNNCIETGQAPSGLNPGGNDNVAFCTFGNWMDCDISGYPTWCSTICHLNRIQGGESSAFGEYSSGTATACCEDDSGEYYREGKGSPSAACCNNSTDMVVDGVCYNAYSCGTNNQGGYCPDSREGDLAQAVCDSCSALWGLTSGNSTSGCFNGRCCGDDPGETPITSQKDSAIAWSDSSKACCNGFWCVRNGQCLDWGTSLNPGGNDNVAVCMPRDPYTNSSKWQDCDNNLGLCGGIVENNECGGSISNPGLYAGESGVGEYPNQTTNQCCGDDANEYVTALCPGVTGVSQKCCNSSGDKIDASGNCVFSCGQPDLMVEDISWSPSLPNQGQTVTFTVTVKNQGNAQAGASVVKYYIDDDLLPSPNSQDDVPALNAGLGSPQTFSWTAQGGSHTVKAVADANSQVSESNEGNNERTETVSVNRPPSVSLSAPANNAPCIATNPTLSWTGSDPDGDVLTYEVWYCSGSGCTPTSRDVTSTTSYNLSGLAGNTIYRWYIKAMDGKGGVDTSPTWQFTTTAGSPTYSVTDGVNSSCNAADTVAVSWANVTNSTGYWGYSSDSTCNASDSYPNNSNSANVNTTHSDYVCFRNSNACETGYSSAQGPLKVDTTQPTITSVTSSSPACNTVRFTVNGANDSGCAGLASSPYSFDGGSSWQSGNTKDYTGTNVTIGGSQVRVKDTLGNTYTYTSSVSGTAAACNTAPNKPTNLSQSPGSEGAWTNDNTPYFNFTISDPDTGDTVGYQIQIDNNSDFSSPNVDYTWAGSVTNPNNVSYQVIAALPDGAYYWRVRAKDAAGLYSAWADDDNGFAGSGVDFNIDTVAPPTPTCSPGSSIFSSTIDVACSDTEPGVTIRYTTNGTEPNVGSTAYSGTLTFNQTTTLKVRAWDAVGNASGTNSYDYTKGNLPNTTIDSNPPNPSNDSTPTFTFSGTGSPTSFDCRYDGTGSWSSCTSPHTYTITQGNHTFEVRANNSYGTDPSPAAYTWLVDLTNPTVSNLSATSPICVNAATSVSWTGADTGGSGLDRQELWRKVGAGAWEGWCNDGSWRADCSAYGGVKNVTSPQTVTLTMTGTTEFGIHIFDNAGNYLYSSSVSVTVNGGPGIPGDPSYSETTQSSTKVSWAAGSGATSHDLYRCAGTGCSRPASATFTNVTSPYTDNTLNASTTYRYWARAINTCGGTYSSQGTEVTTASTQGPILGANPQNSSGWKNTATSITISATDSDGVTFGNAKYLWDINDAKNSGTNFTPAGQIISSPTTNGSHTLYMWAKDNINNESTANFGPYQYDGTRPTVDSFKVNNNTTNFTTEDTSLDITWTISDTGGSGLDQAEVWRQTDGGGWGSNPVYTDPSPSGNGPVNGSWTDNVTCGHTYDYGLHVKDVAVNCSLENNTACGGAGSPITATVNCPAGPNNPPNKPINLKQFGDDHLPNPMIEGETTSDNTPYFTFDISDPDSGDIVGYQIQIDDNDSYNSPVIDYTWDGSTTNPNNVTYQVSNPLPDGSYFWRVRAKDDGGLYSNDWITDNGVMFGGGGVDFKVDTTPEGPNQPPVANFSACKVDANTIKFTDTSTDDSGIASRDWDFGDGSAHSALTNPTHNYQTGGTSLAPGASQVAGVSTPPSRFAPAGQAENTPGSPHFEGGGEEGVNNKKSFIKSFFKNILDVIESVGDFMEMTTSKIISAFKTDITFAQTWNTVFSDNFNDGDYSGWSIVDLNSQPYNWSVISGSVKEKSDSSKSILLSPYSSSDTSYRISTKAKSTGNGNDGIAIIFGYQDSNNHYQFLWDDPINYYGNTARRIIRVQSGSPTTLAEDTGVAMTNNTWYNLQVQVDGGQIQAKVNGSTILTALVSSQLLGSGVYTVDNDNGVWYDDYLIETVSAPTTYNVTLTVTDNGAPALEDAETKILDLVAMTLAGQVITDCPAASYNLLTVQALNYQTFAIDWEASSSNPSGGYDLYRASGDTCDTNPDGAVWTSVKNVASGTYTEDSSIPFVAGQKYCYFVSTNPDQLNNSVSPDCSGGTGGVGATKCPRGAAAVASPSTITDLTISRHCGRLTIQWPEEGAAVDYRLYQCVDKAANKCLDESYFESHKSQISGNESCSGGTCQLEDKEIIPVNIVNPTFSSSYYCYKVSWQDNLGVWSDLPATPTCDYSYCYRAPAWQER